MLFNHLEIPRRWQHYWTKYPEGYTILEALLNWVNQVNSMVDNVNDWNERLDEFIETFDDELKETVALLLAELKENGELADIINEVIFGELNEQIRGHGINVKYPPYPLAGAKGDGETDDYAALQAILDYAKEHNMPVFFPQGKYKTSETLLVEFDDNSTWQPGFKIYGVSPALNQEGDLYGSVIQATNNVGDATLRIQGIPSEDNSFKGMANGFVIEGLGFMGVKGANNGDGLAVKGFCNLTIRNCWSIYNENGFKFERQANTAGSYEYGFGVTLDRIFAVENRGWGIYAHDYGSMNLTLIDPVFQSNELGGLIGAGGPITCYNGGFYGNGGPAVKHMSTLGTSSIHGPHFYATRFESNNTTTLGPQVILEEAITPVLDGCWFLTSTNGEQGIELGEVGWVRRPTIRNCMFNGTTINPDQHAYLIGNYCDGLLIQNCRELNYGEKFGGTVGLKADILYMETGNQIGSPINIVKPNNSRALSTSIIGDTIPRLSITSDGAISWGNGSSSPDIAISRDSANKLLVNGELSAQTLSIGTSAKLYSGAGTPEGTKEAATGSLYLNATGTIGSLLYVKTTGSGTSGWEAIG